MNPSPVHVKSKCTKSQHLLTHLSNKVEKSYLNCRLHVKLLIQRLSQSISWHTSNWSLMKVDICLTHLPNKVEKSCLYASACEIIDSKTKSPIFQCTSHWSLMKVDIVWHAYQIKLRSFVFVAKYVWNY